jgi:hypothetical protein
MDWVERIEAVIRIEKISKLEAAQRQLRTACRLFLDGGDTVSVHTLGWAAHEILEGDPGSAGSFLEEMAQTATPKTARELHEAQNFFKHHQGAPFKTLKFIENLNEWLLLDCGQMYRSITGKLLRESYAVVVWVSFKHPEMNLLKRNPPLMEAITKWRPNKQELLRFVDTDPRLQASEFE